MNVAMQNMNVCTAAPDPHTVKVDGSAPHEAVEPEIQFEPEARASYEISARVLNLIKASGVTKFGFVGNEQYRVFGK